MFRIRVVVRAATLTPAVAAMIAVPAAQATVPPIKAFPKFFSNGVKESSALPHKPVEAVGDLVLHNGVLGNLSCQTIFAGVTYNETETTGGTEKGFDNTTDYSTFNCLSQPPCKVKNTKGEEVEGIYATAESPPEPAGSEAHPTGISSLPWTGELIERETGIRQVLTHHVKIWVVMPPATVGRGNCQGVDFPIEDLEGTTEKEAGYELAPVWINGSKNGLKPSHQEFLGEEGMTEKQFPRTGRLKSGLGEFLPTAPKLITSGLGGGWELVTVE